MTPLAANRSEDQWVWGLDSKGKFTIKSAYNLLRPASTYIKQRNSVWDWRGANRVRFFLWLAFQDKLLTNNEPLQRNLSTDASCSTCQNPNEDVLHIIRDFPFVWEVWSLTRIMAWTGIVKGTLERNALFGNVNPRQVVSPVAWDPGPPSWTVLNSDGSVLQPSGKAVAGGLLRDEMGQCSAAYALNLGICSITRAELRGMIFGLQLAWELGHRRVVAQLYSVVAVILLKVGGDITDQYAAEVLQFWELHNRDWKVQIRDIYREANKAADFLASRGHSLVLGNHIVPISDSSLGFYLRYDCIGIFEDRLISINS
ncbi:Putative ribonuclease H protein At1g65750 [Linum perenne]